MQYLLLINIRIHNIFVKGFPAAAGDVLDAVRRASGHRILFQFKGNDSDIVQRLRRTLMGDVIGCLQLGVLLFKLLELPAADGGAGSLRIIGGAGSHHAAQALEIAVKRVSAFPLAVLSLKEHGLRELASDAHYGV